MYETGQFGRMRRITIILLVAALGIAVVTAFLAKRALNRPPPPTAETAGPVKPAPTSQILIAGRDLAAGTVLKDADVKWQVWPNEAVDRRFIVKLGQGEEARNAFIGATVRQAFLSGEPMMANRVFRQEGAGMMSGILSPGMRAIGVVVTAHSAAGGFILPGDRVDVILTMEMRQNSGNSEDPAKTAQAETVVRNLRVLAVDQKMDDVQSTAVLAKTVTLEVTPKEAETILQAEKAGDITLTLRSLTPGPGDEAGLASAAPEPEPPPPPPPPRRQVSQDGGGNGGQVKVYRGATSTMEAGR
ncbi:MAG: Flp pilus assembly protein CpaB [Rhodospirillales bacterium]|nr:MAG: Flp pilus assembly protein CpaB [Rhodospirillales bacterium]